MSNYVVKDDNPDVGFSLSFGEVKDAEGNAITDPQGLTTEIVSTDQGVLGYTASSDKAGTVHFGAPGQASLQYNVKDANGKVLGSGSDGFTVTTGDPASIAGITASFEGLTPVAETPAPAPVAEPAAATGSETAPAAEAAPGAAPVTGEATGTEGSAPQSPAEGPTDGGVSER